MSGDRLQARQPSPAIRHELDTARITGDQVDHVIVGHVIQAGAGQITARQAAVKGGIPMSVCPDRQQGLSVRTIVSGGGGYEVVQGVPRSWTDLLAEVADHPLDPDTATPAAGGSWSSGAPDVRDRGTSPTAQNPLPRLGRR